MIPILYEKNETNFTSNGLGRLPDCISCKVTEERNGVYELTFEYPINGSNYENIQLGRIVAVTHEPTDDIQPFDIVSCSRPIDGVVTFFATHISYRLNNHIVWKTNINSLEDAMKMLEASTPPNQFTFSADFLSGAYLAAADGIPRTVREMLGGGEGSILDAYGGEYKFDKFNVTLMQNRGRASNLTIRYGLNLTEYNEEIGISESFSSVIPYWDSDKLIIGGLVKSGQSSLWGRETAIPLNLTDKFEEQPTVEQLETYALNYMNSNETHLPSQTIDVDFVDLARSSEYKELAPLLEARLCDTVKVVFPRYKMSGTFKVVKTEYDVLAERFLTMTLGTLATNLSEALGLSNEFGASGNRDITTNKVLWSGGAYMNASQTITLSEPVTKQNKGIVLVWSAYSGGSQNYNWNSVYIPKYVIAMHGGNGWNCTVSNGSQITRKYVYVNDTTISGNAINDSGSNKINGVTVDTRQWVLRYVIGI